MTAGGSKQDQRKNRIFGLDVLRAIAVLSVLAGHTFAHGKPPSWVPRYIGPQAVTGVEIFYVLSGFLIGHILLRSAASGHLHTFADIVDFWKRRWARTLPLYVFFVIIYMRFDYHGVADLRLVWPFFLFLQNLAWPMLPFFDHSWSLAVEEWFYLLLPITFVGLRLLFRSDRHALAGTAILFIGVPFICRLVSGWHATDWSTFDPKVRSMVVCRLDSLFIGVLFAYSRLHHPRAFERIACYWPFSLPILLVLGGMLSVDATLITDHRVLRTVYFPLLSLSIASLLPAVLRLQSTGYYAADAIITHTSKISYSLYLGHAAILTTVIQNMDQMGLRAHNFIGTFLMYVVLFSLYYIFANLTYWCVEQPYIKLRDAKLGYSDVRSGSIAVVAEHRGG